MAKHKFWRVLTRIHKWAGLVLGVQIVLWFSSGLFMSFFSIDKVHGDHMAQNFNWQLQIGKAAPLDEVIAVYTKDQQKLHCRPMQHNACVISPVTNVKLHPGIGVPIWELKNERASHYYAGQPPMEWEGIAEEEIRGAARTYYQGNAEIQSALLFTETPPKDFRKFVPIWQVEFDDSSHTRLYISPQTGALVNVRTRLWRAFDFMWMLHIMDYKERDNINLWWLKLAAFCALLFALSGVGLVTHRVFLRPRAKRKGPE